MQGLAEAQLQLGHLCLRKESHGDSRRSSDSNLNTPTRKNESSRSRDSPTIPIVNEMEGSPGADAILAPSSPPLRSSLSPLSLSPEQRKALPHGVRDAAQWYRAAAKQGLAPAQYNYAILLARGKVRNKGTKETSREQPAISVDIDSAQEHAAKWFRKAAAQGHAAAQRHLDESAPKCLISDFELTGS